MIIAQCPVCKDTLTRGKVIVMAPCGHTYHEYCLFEWLKNKASCPQCRKQCPKARIKKLFFDYVEDPTFSSDSPEMKVARLEAELESKETKIDACEALISNLEAAGKAAAEEVTRARAAVQEERELRQKERSEKERTKTKLAHYMELLKEALVDKNELEELREKVSLLKELEILLKNSASDVADVTAVYVEQAEHDSNQAAVRHLACLLAVLKRELEALKVSKRSMRRERHVLLKEVAALRRQIATEADAVRRAEEELRQEKAYTASLERECDSLREKVRDCDSLREKARGCGEKPSGPKKARKSDIIEPESAFNTPSGRSIANDSALDLFESETPGLQDRLVIDSRYFDTPETPDSTLKQTRAPRVNPFAVARQSITTEEEGPSPAAPVRVKPVAPVLQEFNIMRSHLMAARPTPQPVAAYDGLGSRQRCSSPVFGARRPPPVVSRRRLGRPPGRKREKKSAPVCKTLENFLKRA